MSDKTITVTEAGGGEVSDTPASDLPAIAAWAAFYDIPAEEAACSWPGITERTRQNWRAVVDAVRMTLEAESLDETATPARELREAMAETRRVTETVRPVLDCFTKASDGWRGRVSAVVLARAYAATGPVPDYLKHVEGR